MLENIDNPMIHKAIKILEELSADPKIRDLAERREKALRDEAMFLEEAKRIGREEGKKEGKKEAEKETIRRLLKMKVLTDGQIAEAAGTDIDEVRKLKSEM